MEKTDTYVNQEDQLRIYTSRTLGIVDYTLDDARLETRCPLDNGRQHTKQSRSSAGRLDVFPLEIITAILLELDLPTLTKFRRVNSRAMGLVNSLHPYRMVLKHCPDVLRAIISIDAYFFSCKTLYTALKSKKCDTCSRFGAYLYLITCKRVCYFCFTSDIKYLPVAVMCGVKYTAGRLSRTQLLTRVPSIRSLPGKYTASANRSGSRTLFFDRQAVLKNRLFKTSVHQDWKVQQFDRTTRAPRRYMSIISAPYFSSSGQSADWGFHCLGCRDSTEPMTHFRIKYTKDGIIEHFEQHGAVKVVNQRATHG